MPARERTPQPMLLGMPLTTPEEPEHAAGATPTLLARLRRGACS